MTGSIFTQKDKTFGVDDLIHNGYFYDALNKSIEHDLPFYLKHCREAKGPALELCCGTGRLTVPLAQHGIDITGLDFTPSMLESAIKKSKEACVDAKFVQGDMRNFDLEKKFNLIFIPYNSLQNTYSLSDIQSILECVRRHLNSDGYFVFDIFNPSLELMVNRSRNPHHFQYQLPDGRLVKVVENCRYDSAGQVNRVTWLQHVEGEISSTRHRLDMRCFYPQEMDSILVLSGWEITKKFGAFNESPFDSNSSKQIYICRPLS
jgi:ubiquinone/menaquinone biosynthesis C-methylase UbiE